MKKNHLLNNEKGDTNFVSIIVILAIILIAVLLLRSEWKNLWNWILSLFN